MEKDIYIHELNTIMRTCLIFNSKEELDKFIDFDYSHNNNAGKKSMAARVLAFHKLYKKVYDELSIPLDLLLDDYNYASELAKTAKTKYGKNKEKELFDDLDNCLKGNINEKYIGKLNIGIFILIVLGILPNYNTNKGSVKNIENDFYKTIIFFKRYSERYENQTMYQPVLEKYKTHMAKNGTSGLSRVLLIYMATDIVLQFAKIYSLSISTPISEVNFLKKNIEGVWVKSTEENPNDFFYIESTETKHQYIIIHIKNVNNKIQSEYYNICFRNFGNQIQMFISNLETARKIINKENLDFQSGYLIVSFSQAPTSLSPKNDKSFKAMKFSESINGRVILNFDKLYRTSNLKPYMKNISLHKSLIDKNYIPESTSIFYAITTRNLFFRLSEEDINILKSYHREITDNTKYIKISRQCEIAISIKEITPNLQIFRYGDGKVFLWNSNNRQYIDLTNETSIDKHYIAFVDFIE